MHPSLLYDTAVREQQQRLARDERRHEIALRLRDRAPRPVADTRRSRVRSTLGRTVRATRRTAPAGAPRQRPAATARPAADGHALAA
jgi:hypothetical protein